MFMLNQQIRNFIGKLIFLCLILSVLNTLRIHKLTFIKAFESCRKIENLFSSYSYSYFIKSKENIDIDDNEYKAVYLS